jgi:hypothetical protein
MREGSHFPQLHQRVPRPMYPQYTWQSQAVDNCTINTLRLLSLMTN